MSTASIVMSGKRLRRKLGMVPPPSPMTRALARLFDEHECDWYGASVGKLEMIGVTELDDGLASPPTLEAQDAQAAVVFADEDAVVGRLALENDPLGCSRELAQGEQGDKQTGSQPSERDTAHIRLPARVQRVGAIIAKGNGCAMGTRQRR